MSTLYVLATGGTHLPYEESQAREMLKKGLLGPETLYWKEGMAEWRPLKELPIATEPASKVPGLSSQSPGSSNYRFTKNPEPLTTVVEIMLGVSLLIAIPILLIGVVMLIHTLMQDFKSVQLEARLMQVTGYISAGIYVLTAIPFAMWIYRANLNCRGFAHDLSFTPGMAVGCYFIPFANLVFPYQAMQEIWKASLNPANWKMEKGSILVGFWWILWLIHGFLSYALIFFSRKHADKTLEAITSKLESISLLLIALEILKIIVCIIAFFMIYLIIRNQKRLTETSSLFP